MDRWCVSFERMFLIYEQKFHEVGRMGAWVRSLGLRVYVEA